MALDILLKMKLHLFIIGALISPALAGWRIHDIREIKAEHYYQPAAVSMTYYEDDSGYRTLSDALEELKSQGKINILNFIRPYSLTKSPAFQKELVSAFKELAPQEWADAESSSGNMHNPKVRPLRKHLSDAFMKTTLAKEISRDLEPFNLKISEFGQEKLSYMKTKEGRLIDGIFHIAIAPKVAEQGGADEPATAPQLEPSSSENPNTESKPRPQ
jgi:hypothetical protein